ncbi:hypothetical protein [Formosa sp. A9]|uniref:hypothetical protein n=1 Tax=Formosa sp. A9 TaxID=3442641 RepID=UPI003EBA1A10
MYRLVIYSPDVQAILGCSPSKASELLRIIKDVHDKEKHQSVTIKEFCDYQDLPFEEVFNMINSAVLNS